MDWDVLDATVDFEDARGYHYVGISDSWKRMCLDLPCSKRVQVPPIYKEQHLCTNIDGHEVVIQAWKGNCPKAYREMPGGIGGEVGIYRKIPGRQIPDVLELPRIDAFPIAIRPAVITVVSRILEELVQLAHAGAELWWPYPELDAQIDMRFLHPDRDEELFHADPPEPAGGYWMSRWMNYGSYERYLAHEAVHLRRLPLHTYEYRMELAIKGHRFRWDSPGSQIRPL